MRKLFAILWIILTPSAFAESPSPRIPSKDAIDELAKQVLGKVTQPTHVNWHNHSLELAMHWGSYFEYNNFRTDVRGLLLRLPSDSVVFRLGIDQLKVMATESSRNLAQTRYRQWGRPSRYELKPGAALPLIDAMGFPQQSWMPGLQISLSALFSLHLAYYPEAPGFGEMKAQDRNKLTRITPDGMEIAPERMWTTWGFETAIYSRSGIWLYIDTVTSQLLLSSKNIPVSYEFALGVGYAF